MARHIQEGVNHRVVNLVVEAVKRAQGKGLWLTLEHSWKVEAVDGVWRVYDFEAGPLDCLLDGRPVIDTPYFITRELAAQLGEAPPVAEGLINGVDGCSKYHGQTAEAVAGFVTGQAIMVWAGDELARQDMAKAA